MISSLLRIFNDCDIIISMISLLTNNSCFMNREYITYVQFDSRRQNYQCKILNSLKVKLIQDDVIYSQLCDSYEHNYIDEM